jgi:hypothetical protein
MNMSIMANDGKCGAEFHMHEADGHMYNYTCFSEFSNFNFSSDSDIVVELNEQKRVFSALASAIRQIVAAWKAIGTNIGDVPGHEIAISRCLEHARDCSKVASNYECAVAKIEDALAKSAEIEAALAKSYAEGEAKIVKAAKNAASKAKEKAVEAQGIALRIKGEASVSNREVMLESIQKVALEAQTWANDAAKARISKVPLMDPKAVQCHELDAVAVEAQMAAWAADFEVRWAKAWHGTWSVDRDDAEICEVWQAVGEANRAVCNILNELFALPQMERAKSALNRANLAAGRIKGYRLREDAMESLKNGKDVFVRVGIQRIKTRFNLDFVYE